MEAMLTSGMTKPPDAWIMSSWLDEGCPIGMDGNMHTTASSANGPTVHRRPATSTVTDTVPKLVP